MLKNLFVLSMVMISSIASQAQENRPGQIEDVVSRNSTELRGRDVTYKGQHFLAATAEELYFAKKWNNEKELMNVTTQRANQVCQVAGHSRSVELSWENLHLVSDSPVIQKVITFVNGNMVPTDTKRLETFSLPGDVGFTKKTETGLIAIFRDLRCQKN